MKNSEIDFLLDDIRKSCELGEIEQVILLSEKLKSITSKKESALSWLKNKLLIKDGSTYTHPNIGLRQCASFIDEYSKYVKIKKPAN